MAHRGKAGSPATVIAVVVSAVVVILLSATSGSAGVGEWTVTGGPASQRGNAQLLAVDAANEGVAYTVIEVAGLHRLYRTADRGGNWAAVHAFQEAIGSLAISDTSLYLGATDVPAGQPAIWRSTNTGATWSPVFTAAVTTTVNALTMAPDSPNHAYAALTTAGGGAVIKSTTGVSWSLVLTNTGSFDAVAVDASDPTRAFAAGNTGGRGNRQGEIHRTTNGGAAWTAVSPATTEMFEEFLAVHPDNPEIVFAKTRVDYCCPPPDGHIWRSTDAGISWTRAITVPGMYPGMSVLRVDPDGYVYVAGRTWDPPVATVIRSDDRGESWGTIYEGGETLIRDLTFDPEYPTDVYLIDDTNLLKSTDRGENWETILTSEKRLHTVLHDPTIPERLYLGMEGPAILMSYDGGGSWLELENWEGEVLAPHVMSLAAGGDPVQRTVYAGLDGVWRYVLTGTEGNVAPSEGGTLAVSSSESAALSARTANGALAAEDVALTIQVPPGAVEEATRLLYMPALEPIAWLESSGMRSAGHAFTLDAYEAGGHVKNFAFGEPVTVTLYYSDAAVAGIDEAGLTLQRWENGDSSDAAATCQPASAYTRNLEENWLSVPICHLSYYALAGDPQYTLNVPVIMR